MLPITNSTELDRLSISLLQAIRPRLERSASLSTGIHTVRDPFVKRQHGKCIEIGKLDQATHFPEAFE